MKNLSRNAFFLAVACILFASILYPKWNKSGSEATISWDVSGYYMYLPAVFIYQDLKDLEFVPEITEKYHPSPIFGQAFLHESGNYVLKYSVGWSVLNTPFFLIGHAVASLTGYPADGFSRPYQWAIGWGSLLVAFIGLWFCRLTLLRYFSDRETALTLLILVLGTNYLNYSAIGSALSHNYLFTLYAILVWQSIHFYESPSGKRAIGVGLIVGLMALTRPTEIIAMIIPLLWGVGSWKDLVARFGFWKQHWRFLGMSALTVALVGSLQLIYWKYASGDWLVYSYEDQGFSWLNPHFMDVFFSYRKGWLVYTPLMALAIAGFIPLWKKARPTFFAAILFFLVSTYIVCAWDIWWYGGSFGQRAMVQSYALLAFPISALLAWAKGKRLTSLFLSIFILAGIALNILQTIQIHNGTLHPEYMTKAYYWRVFGKLNADTRDQFLLDTKEDFRGNREAIVAVFEEDFEEFPNHPTLDTLEAKSGRKAIHLDGDRQFSPDLSFSTDRLPEGSEWIRISGQFLFHEKEYNSWRFPQMVCLLKKDGEVRKTRMIRLPRLLHPGYWQEEYMDVSLPDYPVDTISIHFWQASSQKEFYLDDVRVEAYRE